MLDPGRTPGAWPPKFGARSNSLPQRFGRNTGRAKGETRPVPRESEALRAKWGWIVALGTIYVLVGPIALYSVVMATVGVFVVGIMMLIAGVAEVINAFQVKSWGKFFLWIDLGVLYIVAGFVTFETRHSLRFQPVSQDSPRLSHMVLRRRDG